MPLRMKSLMNCRLYVPSALTPGSQLPPVWPVSFPEPTYPAFTGGLTAKLPEQPPPPIPWVLPFHAPSTPPVPPSSELSGRPTRMLMFWLALAPNMMSTWQKALFAPAASTFLLDADFKVGFPARPFAGSVASSAQVTGWGGGACLLLSAEAGAARAQRIGTAANRTCFRMAPP